MKACTQALQHTKFIRLETNMDKLKMHSPDITQQNINKLLELFPNCKTEKQDDNGELCTGIDFDLLKQELSKNIVEGPQERYQLNWPGKKEALLTANAPIAKTLRPCREESVNFDTTENLFIEGDNLEALKLLQETYLGKVKMIYIDPPYNTGKDFIYADNFAESTDEYLRDSGQKDEKGNRLVANADSNGRFHSDWLSMMYSRLKLARNLLREDGMIFISIDDNEYTNVKKICDEIFGEKLLVGTVAWKNKYGAGAKTKGFIEVHEYILCYSKSLIENISSKLSNDQAKNYNKKDDKFDIRGGYFTQPLMTTSMDERPNLQYGIEYKGEVIKPIKQWVWGKERLLNAIQNNEVVFSKKTDGSYSVRSKVYLIGENGVRRRGKPMSLLNGPFNQEGTKEVEELIGPAIFSFPKPSALIAHFLSFEVNDKPEADGLYLDFFSGSGTTAHAVMQLNSEDDGSRKCISVQLPEIIDEKSQAFKAGYSNIAEISKERIRRAGQKIKEESPESTSLDTGFRVLKIDSSNMNDVRYTPDSVAKGDLLDQIEHIKPDRSSEDLLFEVMLYWGVDLSLPILKETIEGKEVYFVNDDDLVACFDKGIDEALIKALAEKQPLRVVFRDDGFVSDSVKVNVEQIFKQLAPATDIKAI